MFIYSLRNYIYVREYMDIARASANVWVLRCALAASMCAWVELDPERHPSDKDGVIRLGGYLVELLSLSLPSTLISCIVYFFEQCAVTEKFPCR